MANNFKNAGILVGTSRTTLYTCPTSTTAVIHALYISNISLSSIVDIEITIDGGVSGNYFHIGKSLDVPSKSTLVFDKPINLEAGDILAITSSAANSNEAVCAVLEIS